VVNESKVRLMNATSLLEGGVISPA
jgi:hypothetical protein